MYAWTYWDITNTNKYFKHIPNYIYDILEPIHKKVPNSYKYYNWNAITGSIIYNVLCSYTRYIIYF